MTRYKFKIVIVGDYGVGKTSLINQYVTQKFKESYIPTLGVQFTKKILKKSDNDVELVIWDIAGQDSFSKIRQRFYDHTQGFIIVYDLTRKSSLENIKNWYDDGMAHTGKLPCLLLGNKSDLTENRVINEEDVTEIIEKHEMNFNNLFETSAKTGENVEEIFELLAGHILKKIIQSSRGE